MACTVASLVHVHGYVHAHGEERERLLEQAGL
jgi:hypothetical protein